MQNALSVRYSQSNVFKEPPNIIRNEMAWNRLL